MSNAQPALLVDGHVHFYACFDADALLDAAVRTFSRRAEGAGLARWRSVLLLTESRRDAVFEELATRGTYKGRPLARWRVEPTSEPEALRVTSNGHEHLIVAGFQVATREDLEVLAIGTRHRVPDGLEFFDSYTKVRESGAFPIVPWGFGKWSLQRGQIIRRLMETASPNDVAFGDNGGRIAGLPMPSLLKFAKERGFAVLPGTDPLPFPDQGRRVGTSGFIVDADKNLTPVASIKSAFARPGATSSYLSLTSPVSFAMAQARMQIRKRFG